MCLHLQVLPIEKKVFWDDLKIARKIYQRKAIVKNDGGFSQDVEANMRVETNAGNEKTVE